MESDNKENKEGGTVITSGVVNFGINCQICSEFMEGVMQALMCDKCGEALKELILKQRGLKQ